MEAGPTNWKAFEQAVASFVAAIAPDARVTHDVKIPDVHTGEPRQRDVWIEWVLGGLFPTKALISCKYWATKLDEQDLDHFNGEYLSSGAKIGIIYAKAGFTAEAIRKSQVLNFHCCKLYSDAPAELPEQLCLGLAYHIAPVFRFSLTSSYASQYGLWNDVFERRLDDSTVREVICRLIEPGDTAVWWLVY